MTAQRSRIPRSMTVDEFLVHNFPDGKVELVRGEAVVNPPAGGPHAVITMNVVRKLLRYVDEHNLGRVFGDGAGFELRALPRTVRSPDVSFVRAERLPAEGIGRGFLAMVPDLAVEVLSPTETASRLQAKLDDYRAVGIPLIWVIDPDRRRMSVLVRGVDVRVLEVDDTLDGDDILPGFSCSVAAFFEGLAP